MSFLTVLFLVLLVLQLVGVIAVSWWVVFAPLIVLVVIYIGFFLLLARFFG